MVIFPAKATNNPHGLRVRLTIGDSLDVYGGCMVWHGRGCDYGVVRRQDVSVAVPIVCVQESVIASREQLPHNDVSAEVEGRVIERVRILNYTDSGRL